jgi:hypothetical protein
MIQNSDAKWTYHSATQIATSITSPLASTAGQRRRWKQIWKRNHTETPCLIQRAGAGTLQHRDRLLPQEHHSEKNQAPVADLASETCAETLDKAPNTG